MSTLKIENITKKYGDTTVVNNFEASIRQGELVTIVGPSGCGKTTTLRMIAGFVEPTVGKIQLGNRELVNTESKKFIEPEKREIGMVFQSYAVWPHMNVFNNVAYPLKLRKINKEEIAKRTRDALKLVHLEKYEKSFVHELSGGQQQRVALARALVMEPELLLLDEPLSNLDATLRESMRGEIKEIQHKLNVTIINVTHDQIEALTMSDRVIVMNKGKVIQIGTPEEIYNNPINSFVAKFIGSSNVIECEYIKTTDDKMKVNILGHEIEILNENRKKDVGFLSIRPHLIKIDKSSPIKGKVTRILYQGDRIEYHIKVNNERIRLFTDARIKYNLGDIIPICLKEAIWLND